MGLTAKAKSEGNYELIPAGMYQGICYSVYDLGHQEGSYMGKDKITHKVMIGWEIPEIRIEIEKDGEKLDLPKAMSKDYTLSLGKKSNLRKDLESWKGKPFTEKELEGFDLQNILGKNCLLQVQHGTSKSTGNDYAFIASINPIMRNMEIKETENELKFFSFEDNGMDIPDYIPEWIQTKIKESLEFQHNERTATDKPSLGESIKNGDQPWENEIPPIDTYHVPDDEIPF